MFAQFSHRIAVITATSALLAASTFAYPLHTTAEPIAEDAIAHEYDYLEIPEDPFDETGEHLSPDLDIDDPDLDEDTTTPTEKSADPATELELSDLPQASGPLQCTPGNFYSLGSHRLQAGQVYHIGDTGAGFTPSTEPLIDFSTLAYPKNPQGRPSLNQAFNGLAIGDDGKKAYAVNLEVRNKNTGLLNSTGIYQWDATTNEVTVGTYFDPTPVIGTRYFIAGGINPSTNDTYYFGGYKAVFNKGKYEIRFHLFAYDPATQQVGHLGYVPVYKATFLNNLHNGDLAFDQDGNMYILYHNPTYNVIRVVPVTAESLAEAQANGAVYADGEKPLSTANDNYEIVPQNVRDLDKFQRIGGTYNGLAFAADGNMYAETTNFGSGTVTIQKLDSNSGARLYSGTGNSRWTMGLDLASCTRIPTIELKKNIISRDKPTDQFKLDIFREDLGTAKDKELTSATTTGSSTGIQKEYAGPIPAVVGKRYRIQESGAANESASPANLKNYRSSVICVDEQKNTKLDLIEVSDNTRAWIVEVPDSAEYDNPRISCTYTNEASGDIIWKKISEKDADKDKDKASGLASSTWELRKQGDAQVLATIEDFVCDKPTSAECMKKIKEQNRLSELDYADTNPAAGEFLVPHLPYGSYTLTETKAPEGYLLRKDPIEFTIDDSSERPYPVNDGVITNKPSQAEIS
ncbi:prealbumin-like fold domain-containing protein [Corynebacterium kutscheri]